LSVHFVNTSGAGILVAPHGGLNRRLSANPVAAGVPVKGGPPVILDISTSTIAEGKIKVALNKGTRVPDHCLLDGHGRPTNDPRAFYGPPPGAILPVGGHKGYALGVIAELFAGALSGGSCSNPKETRVVNNMLTVLIDPSFFVSEDDFAAEARRFLDYVKSADRVAPDAEILTPGEPERRTRAQRLRDGIELDETTWGQIRAACRLVGLSDQRVAELTGGPA
jgi:hydroxycarboxylate dehydrogenase B